MAPSKLAAAHSNTLQYRHRKHLSHLSQHQRLTEKFKIGSFTFLLDPDID